jgi:hypothetical protein
MDIQKWLREERSTLTEDDVLRLIKRDSRHLFWQNDSLKVQIFIKALLSSMILLSDTIAQYLDLTDDLNQRIAMILCGPNTHRQSIRDKNIHPTVQWESFERRPRNCDPLQ